MRADPAETQKIRNRMRAKSAPPRPATSSKAPTDTLPPVPPPAGPPPPTSTTGKGASSSSAYPTLNKAQAKEKLGGNIRVKRPTGAAAAAADEYYEPIAAGMFDIQPSKIGIQPLFELLDNAVNKNKLSKNDQSKYTVAKKKWELGFSTKSDKLKDEARHELREIYRRLFFKKPRF